VELLPPDTPDFPRVSRQARAIYRLLYENQDRPLTMLEIRELTEDELGEQEQLDRRRRELNRYFVIEHTSEGRETRYRLVGMKPAALEYPEAGISERDRAAVLSAGRCSMCGKTPVEDGVRLQVDHKIPQDWGGSNELDNLQPLCEECNRGKKAYFATFSEDADKIRQAITHDEPHRRIGELLKAFQGEPVRSDLIAIVASAQQYQEDWQKRLRELRTLGWKISVSRRREDGRVRAYYKLERSAPWPGGSIRAEISRRERAAKQ
jgi:5-methylcytosine-specific restriction endonuclease McrA